MSESRPSALTVAGLDPSAGAGLLADIKAFEANAVYGLGVCTAITAQHDRALGSVRWLQESEIAEQATMLFERFDIGWAKIGITESLDSLECIVNLLHSMNGSLGIVWDPVLRSSTGHTFLRIGDFSRVARLCRRLALVTPNTEEAMALTGANSAGEGAGLLSACCPVLLKGGHGTDDGIKDVLYDGHAEAYFPSERIPDGDKHGSGCVLSAAVTAHLALGAPLREACRRGIDYTQRFLRSSPSLIGYHAV